LLKYVVGFSKEDLRQAFSSRMRAPYDVADLLQRYSERKIRIVDMIGRRGRFITLGMTGFFYLYASIEADPTADFATKFLGNNLFDAVATSWILLGLAIAIAISTTALELFSLRGTDDFTMATANALICLGFGILVR
jgi:hypothetical protein